MCVVLWFYSVFGGLFAWCVGCTCLLCVFVLFDLGCGFGFALTVAAC